LTPSLFFVLKIEKIIRVFLVTEKKRGKKMKNENGGSVGFEPAPLVYGSKWGGLIHQLPPSSRAADPLTPRWRRR
jgi:hypothetical protein